MNTHDLQDHLLAIVRGIRHNAVENASVHLVRGFEVLRLARCDVLGLVVVESVLALLLELPEGPEAETARLDGLGGHGDGGADQHGQLEDGLELHSIGRSGGLFEELRLLYRKCELCEMNDLVQKASQPVLCRRRPRSHSIRLRVFWSSLRVVY